MTFKTVPSRAEFDDLIIRLQRDLAWQNCRLENCKDHSGTLAKYLRGKIQVIGQELTNVRKARVSHYGTFDETPLLPKRVRVFDESVNPTATRLDARGKVKPKGSKGRN